MCIILIHRLVPYGFVSVTKMNINFTLEVRKSANYISGLKA